MSHSSSRLSANRRQSSGRNALPHRQVRPERAGYQGADGRPIVRAMSWERQAPPQKVKAREGSLRDNMRESRNSERPMARTACGFLLKVVDLMVVMTSAD